MQKRIQAWVGLALAFTTSAVLATEYPYALPAGSSTHSFSAPSGIEDCSEAGQGETYDNGSAQNGYGANPDLTDQVTLVQRFNPGGEDVAYSAVCLGFTRTGPDDAPMMFEIVAYNGVTGVPSMEVVSIGALARNIPEFPAFAWYRFDLSSMPVEAGFPIFLGVRWAPTKSAAHLIAVDENESTPRNPGFFNAHQGAGWQFIHNQLGFERYRALMVRAEHHTTSHTVTTSVAKGQGAISPASQTVAPGESAHFTLTPEAGWQVDAVHGDSCMPLDSGDGTWTAVDIQADCSVAAHFSRPTFNLETTIKGEGEIAVEPPQDYYHYGDVVRLTATPAEGWKFMHWTDNLSQSANTANPLDVLMKEDTVVTALFEPSDPGVSPAPVAIPAISVPGLALLALCLFAAALRVLPQGAGTGGNEVFGEQMHNQVANPTSQSVGSRSPLARPGTPDFNWRKKP